MDLFTTEFELLHEETGRLVKVSINVDDELYFVNVEGKFIGALEKDGLSPLGYTSVDKELLPYLGQIVAYLKAKHDDR